MKTTQSKIENGTNSESLGSKLNSFDCNCIYDWDEEAGCYRDKNTNEVQDNIDLDDASDEDDDEADDSSGENESEVESTSTDHEEDSQESEDDEADDSCGEIESFLKDDSTEQEDNSKSSSKKGSKLVVLAGVGILGAAALAASTFKKILGNADDEGATEQLIGMNITDSSNMFTAGPPAPDVSHVAQVGMPPPVPNGVTVQAGQAGAQAGHVADADVPPTTSKAAINTYFKIWNFSAALIFVLNFGTLRWRALIANEPWWMIMFAWFFLLVQGMLQRYVIEIPLVSFATLLVKPVPDQLADGRDLTCIINYNLLANSKAEADTALENAFDAYLGNQI